MEASNRLNKLDGQRLDLIVIGGGVIGSGIASDAANRGLRVALFEKEDYACGTSSRSTRLIHGGLRYLEMFDFGLVRQDLKEREMLLRNAPHLVKPLPFMVPMYSKSLFYRLKMRVGMVLYDVLSYDKTLRNHRFYSKKQTLEMEPNLKEKGLQGSFIYYDAQVPYTERLVIENIISAEKNGALCFNHVKVLKAVKEGNSVTGALVRDELTGVEREVKARLVVNVTGPWLDPVDEAMVEAPSHRVRKTKGIHFTATNVTTNAMVLFAESDNRLFFVIPWLGYAWVGTTDTDFKNELESVRADREDVEYLVASVKQVFPNADWDKIFFTNAGVRSLVMKETSQGISESAVSRKHAIVDFEKKQGLKNYLSVVGGKLTAYRGIAEEATDAALKKLGLKCEGQTASTKLPGAQFEGSFEQFILTMAEEGTTIGLSVAQVKYLSTLYGSRITEIFEIVRANPALAQPLHSAYPDVRAQVKHAVEREQCLTLCDFMMRRCGLYFSKDQGQQAIEAASRDMALLLGWDEERRQSEIKAYLTEVGWTQEWKEKSAPRAESLAGIR
jgi:glycerol-3-phosphate dehydrogenase